MLSATLTRTISRYVPWAHVYNLLLEILDHQIRVVRGIPLLEAMASATEFRMLRIMILVSKYAYGIDLAGVDLLLGGMARFHATRQYQYLLHAINDIALYSFSLLHPGHRMLYEDWVGFDPSSGIRILRLLKVRETNQYYHLAEIVVRTMSALVCHALGVDIREVGATHLEYSQYQLSLSKVLARCEDEATTDLVFPSRRQRRRSSGIQRARAVAVSRARQEPMRVYRIFSISESWLYRAGVSIDEPLDVISSSESFVSI